MNHLTAMLTADFDFIANLNPETLEALEAQAKRPRLLELEQVLLAKALWTFVADASDALQVNGPNPDLEALLKKAEALATEISGSLSDQGYRVLHDGVAVRA